MENSESMNRVPQSAEEADALISAIEAPSYDHPDQGPAVPQNKTETTEQMVTITRGGQEIQVPYSKALQFAQQGYDYSQRMNDYNAQVQKFQQEQSAWNQERSEMQQRWAQYDEISKYAEQNPQWWGLVQNAWQKELQRSQGGAPQGTSPQMDIASHPMFQQLQQQLEEMRGFVNAQKEREEAIANEKANAALDQAIDEFQKQYPSFQWNVLDESNMTLTDKIINYAAQNEIPSFRAAALAYLEPQLVGKLQMDGKQQAGEAIRRQTELGLGANLQPGGLSGAFNTAEKTYEDLANEAIRELGIAQY